MAGAVREVTALAYDSFVSGDVQAARQVEPLEQVIDDLKEEMRTRHIRRMQQGSCGIRRIWRVRISSPISNASATIAPILPAV